MLVSECLRGFARSQCFRRTPRRTDAHRDASGLIIEQTFSLVRSPGSGPSKRLLRVKSSRRACATSEHGLVARSRRLGLRPPRSISAGMFGVATCSSFRWPAVSVRRRFVLSGARRSSPERQPQASCALDSGCFRSWGRSGQLRMNARISALTSLACVVCTPCGAPE